MKISRWLAGVLDLFVAFMVCGCVASKGQVKSANRAAIDGRADRIFSKVILIKPTGMTETNAEVWRLAPLFVQEIYSTNASTAGPSEIYFSESETNLNGRSHGQINFAWRPQSNAPIHQLQIVLDTNGLPAIEEITREDSKVRLVFVSQNLEASAIRELGQPLADRRFALERSVMDAPSTIVVREFNDAPMAMGPIVHLDAHGNVTTVICRCMSTQAKELAGVGSYRLLPMDRHWQQRMRVGDLNKILRLPSGF